MRSRLPQFVQIICLASLIVSACAPGGNARQSNETAERILTAVAAQSTATQTTSSSTAATTSPTPAEPTTTPQPPMVFARCIVRAESPMRREPGEAAPMTTSLQPSEIVTAYGRTMDGQWILTWNRDITYGWIPSSVLGCTAPFEDLRPTQPDILLTPQPTIRPTTFPGPLTGAATATPERVAAATTETAAPAEGTATGTAAEGVPVEPSPGPTETPPTALETSTPTPADVTTTPTSTPIVATPEVTATAAITMLAESATPQVTPTVAEAQAPPEPLTCVVAINRALNLRGGPARTARLLGQLRPGAQFAATGRNDDATWLYGATERGDFGWVIASAVRCDGDVETLPIVNGGD